VKTLVDQAMEAGEHTVSWDATDNSGQTVSSGIYFYRMVTGDHSDRKKMLLLR
jgi:flagellar hook assembly protein FlgD